MEIEERAGGGGERADWWSWGAGTHGQLGTGSFQDELLPQPLPPLSPSPLLHLACGGSHSVAALRKGEAMTWGNNSSGQLGHGNSQNCCEPTLVRELQGLKIQTVSAGWSHTAFISDDHTLFTCGSGGYGQLGHGDFDSCSIPRRVMCFASMKVFLAACGMRHTLILAGSGEGASVYAFGSSKKGQLGIELPGGGTLVKPSLETNRRCHPSLIGSLVGCKISSIHANGDHSAALSDSGDLYFWGRGFDTTNNIMLPSKVSGKLCFSQVALGWNHLLALTYEGELYATGSRQRLGVLNALGAVTDTKSCDSESADISASSSPVASVSVDLFEPLKGVLVRWIAAGSEHSAAILNDGSVVTWGWGEHGQLGLGNTVDQSCPNIVPGVPRRMHSRVYCGSGFSFLCQSYIKSSLILASQEKGTMSKDW